MKKHLFSAIALSLGVAALFLNAKVVTDNPKETTLKLNSVLKVYATTEGGSGAESGTPAGSGGGSLDGKGYGYKVDQIECGKEYDALVSTSTNTGSGAGVEVEAGSVIPGTNITAGVTGKYFTSAGSSTIATNKTNTIKDRCLTAHIWEYCPGPISCRVILGY